MLWGQFIKLSGNLPAYTIVSWFPMEGLCNASANAQKLYLAPFAKIFNFKVYVYIESFINVRRYLYEP